MANLRQIRRRIRFIQNTQAVMRAMQLVSASKLKRTQDRLLQSRIVAGYLSELVTRLIGTQARGHVGTLFDHPLCQPREPMTAVALVVITSDAGLCGSYNSHLISLAESHLRQDSKVPVRVVLIGKRGVRYFTKRGYSVFSSRQDLAGRPNPFVIRQMATELMEAFLAKRLDAVQVAYTRFSSTTNFRPTVEPWLPLHSGTQAPSHVGTEARGHAGTSDYIFEPSKERVLAETLPRFALAKFQLMVLEAFTSEHSARMIAMKNATDNAQELLDSLTRQRNKVRQAAITKELSEIVGTAEALK